MFGKRIAVSLVFVASGLLGVVPGALSYEVSDLPELKKSKHAACPRVWESMYSRVIYIDGNRIGEPAGDFYQLGDDIWHGNPTDKSRYITFAYQRLIPVSGQLTIDYASADASVIVACSNARRDVIETLIQARNDETGGYNINLVKDNDSDGVFNISDSCPQEFRTCVQIKDQCADTPLGEEVDTDGPWEGCSASQKDTDGDGVSDDVDQCDATPAGEVADSEGVFIGCSITQKDTDGDGLNDAYDQCMDTEEGLDVNFEGCALNQIDTDNDGLFDDEDEYPHQHKDMCYP